jgi:hypothetical protein
MLTSMPTIRSQKPSDLELAVLARGNAQKKIEAPLA